MARCERSRGKNGYLRAINKFEYLQDGSVYSEKTTNPFQVFSGIVYNKGAFVLHSLRGQVGDESFFKILKEYYKIYKYKNISTADFQSICELISGKELEVFFSQWIYGNGHPQFYYSYYQHPKTLDITLNLRQVQASRLNPPFDVPIQIYLDLNYKDSIITIENSETYQEYVIPCKQKLLNLDIDPNNWILKEIVMKKEIIEKSNNSVYQVDIEPNLSGRVIDLTLKSSKRQRTSFKLNNQYNKTIFKKSILVAGTSVQNIHIPRNIEGGYYIIEIETKHEKYFKNLIILD